MVKLPAGKPISSVSYFLVQLPRSSVEGRSYEEEMSREEEESGRSITDLPLSILFLPFVPFGERTIVLEDKESRGNKRLSINFLTNPF